MSNPSPIEARGRERSIRETVTMAASTIVGFFLSLARTKLLALAWGPAGIGAIGLIQSAMGTGTLLFGLGVDSIAAREIARARSEAGGQAERLVSAVVLGSPIVALAGASAALLTFALFDDLLGLESPWAVALAALGVWASLVSANLRGLLAASARIAALARSTVVAATIAALLSAALANWGQSTVTVALAVVVVPSTQLLAFVVATLALRPKLHLRAAANSIRMAFAFAKEGVLLALAGVLPPLSQLIIRSLARSELDSVGLGYFQASMALAALSISVLASSVGPSLLPRLSAESANPSEFTRIVNEQTLVYLVLYAPVVFALSSLPHLALRVLYAEPFVAASGQLAWQMLGEVVRLPCWVLATVLTVRRRTGAYFVVELVALVTTVAAVVGGLEFGSSSLTGALLSLSTFGQFVLLSLICRREGIAWSREIWREVCLVGAGCVLAVVTTPLHPAFMALVVLGLGFWSVRAVRLLASLRRST